MDWVCPECGLDYGTLHPPIAINAIKSFPRRYAEALAPRSDEDTDAVIRARPAEGVWSALEYTAHVADEMDPMATVIERMNTETDPDLSEVFWDPDQRALDQDYNAKAKDDVLAEMKSGCERLVRVAESINAHSWARTATFPWGERDMLTMLQNAVHEGVHHLKDLERNLEKLRDRA